MSERPNYLPDTVLGNIDAVLDLEQRAEQSTPRVWRFAHWLGGAVGSIAFVIIHLLLFTTWLVLNSGLWPDLLFDPFPFTLLGTLVSCESVVLTTFVLIKQNREGQKASHRSHLDLQVNLLAEQEMTRVLQLVQSIADRVGADNSGDEKTRALMAETAIGTLSKQLEDRSVKAADGH